MTELDFDKLATQGYTRIPVVAEVRADLYTPLAVYAKLATGPYSYLLESVVGGGRFRGHSFICLACAGRVEARGPPGRQALRARSGAGGRLRTAGEADTVADVGASLQGPRARPARAARRPR